MLDPNRTVCVLNDMVNAGLRRRNDPEHNKKIADSELIPHVVKLVSGLRERGVPIFWIRVERRADRRDIIDNLTDVKSGWHLPSPIVAGSYEGTNVEELPVQPEDQVVMKPRFDPFVGTDLDIQLRARGADTVLLGGYSTNIGVESCARTAHDLGYNVVLLSDCCYNVRSDMHDFAIAHVLPRFARVMTSEEMFGLLP